jgi:hypothetical protein
MFYSLVGIYGADDRLMSSLERPRVRLMSLLEGPRARLMSSLERQRDSITRLRPTLRTLSEMSRSSLNRLFQ